MARSKKATSRKNAKSQPTVEVKVGARTLTNEKLLESLKKFKPSLPMSVYLSDAKEDLKRT